jgi:hypothetical protein
VGYRHWATGPMSYVPATHPAAEPKVETVNMQVEDYLRTDGRRRGVRDDWEVRTGPDGVVVTAWTSDRFVRAEQATRAAERVLHDILNLGYRVSGACEMDAEMDLDGDWRGHLTAQIEPLANAAL